MAPTTLLCWGPLSVGCCASRRRSACATSRSSASRSASASHTCARCLHRGRFNFEEAVSGADRVTVAITLFALLELYKRGEAAWEQAESFGEIEVHALSAESAAAVGAGAAG